MNINKLKIGDTVQCKYKYTGANYGKFYDLGVKSEVGRKGNPLQIRLDTFEFFDKDKVADPKMYSFSNMLEMLTTRNLEMTKKQLTDGLLIETEQIDYKNYREMYSITSTENSKITAIPQDVLVYNTSSINVQDYIDPAMPTDGLDSISVVLSDNIEAKFAFSENGTDWVTFKDNDWVPVDLTKDLDTLKNEMIDAVALNGMVRANFDKFTNKIHIATLLSFTTVQEPTPNYRYGIKSITFKFTSATIAGVEENFNFVYGGKTKNGKYHMFMADRVIQTGIAFNTIYNNGEVTKTSNNYIEATFEKSLIGGKKHIMIPTTDVVDQNIPAGIYDIFVENAPSPNKVRFWHTGIGTITNTKYSTGTNIFIAGGPQAAKKINVANTAVADTYGFRPVLLIEDTSYNTEAPAYEVVNRIQDLGPGKCIECDYIASSNAVGTFFNLGKAKMGYIPNNGKVPTPYGRFAFNYVGKREDGSIVLMADRVIQTNISYHSIFTKFGDPKLFGGGTSLTIDNTTTVKLTIPSTVVDSNLIKEEYQRLSQYDRYVSGAEKLGFTEDQVWHTANTLTITKTLTDVGTIAPHLKGLSRDIRSDSTYPSRYHQTNTVFSDIAGFRPVLIIPPTYIEPTFSATPYNLYEAHDEFKTCKINFEYIKDGAPAKYIIRNTSNVDITEAKESGHEIPYTELATLTNNVQSNTFHIVDADDKKKLFEFQIRREFKNRTSSNSVMTTDAENEFIHDKSIMSRSSRYVATASSNSTSKLEVVKDGTGVYIPLDGTIDKINAK